MIVGRGAACESPCRAIHPELPRRGIEGLRPFSPQRQLRRGRAFAFLCALCVSAVIASAFFSAQLRNYTLAGFSRFRNSPAPTLPTNLPFSTITLPRDKTVFGTPFTRVPSNIE
jgi:hypothetical protein